MEELLRERGFIYTLAPPLKRDLSLDPEKVLDADWTARLSYHEFSFLAGLLAKHPIDLALPSNPVVPSDQVEGADCLLAEIHATYG